MSDRPRIAIPEPTSFDHVYNQRSWPQYAHAVQCSGGIPVPVPLTESQASVARIVSGCSGILLPGSPADLDPQKYGQERQPSTAASDASRESVDDLLMQDAFHLHKPVLGICFGLQSMNAWKNGALNQDVSSSKVDHSAGSEVLKAHRIFIEPGSRLASILKEEDGGVIEVNSSHHQAVTIVGDGLTVTARSTEDEVIEAVEDLSKEGFVIGVQWHPERTFGVEAISRRLFDAFIEAAQQWKLRPILESVAFDFDHA